LSMTPYSRTPILHLWIVNLSLNKMSKLVSHLSYDKIYANFYCPNLHLFGIGEYFVLLIYQTIQIFCYLQTYFSFQYDINLHTNLHNEWAIYKILFNYPHFIIFLEQALYVWVFLSQIVETAGKRKCRAFVLRYR